MIRVFLLLTLTAACECTSGCGGGWLEFRGHCYSFNEEKLTWFLAAASCNYYKSNLVKIDNAEENIWLVSQLVESNFGSVWAGGTARNHKGYWEWIPSQTSFAKYNNWFPGEPNNVASSEQCLEIRVEHGYKWNDLNCETPTQFICEKTKPLLL